ncbi:hypothetical protein AWI71_14860 [Listeria monocytogenes]|nr:hypothetical protein AWI71_14860 [Listeria monocytogenes]
MVLALSIGGAAVLFGSMAFIILVTGLLHPTVYNVVGDLYPAGAVAYTHLTRPTTPYVGITEDETPLNKKIASTRTI